MKPSSLISSLTLGVVALTVIGCSILKPQPDLTQFYVLRSPQPQADAHRQPADAQSPFSLRVGPGRIADYLRSTPILISRGPNRVQPLDLHHWAEPLDQGINRLLIENLQQWLPDLDIAPYAEPAHQEPAFQLRYLVTRFEGAPGNDLNLTVSWSLHDQSSGQLLSEQTFRHATPLDTSPDNIEAYVSRMSAAVAEWSQVIARALPQPTAE